MARPKYRIKKASIGAMYGDCDVWVVVGKTGKPMKVFGGDNYTLLKSEAARKCSQLNESQKRAWKKRGKEVRVGVSR